MSRYRILSADRASQGPTAIACLPPLAVAWECDLSDDSLRWSRGVFDLFGIPHDAQVERPDIVAMYCEESRELLERLRSRAIAECGSFTFEAQILRLDGTPRWLRITADTAPRNGRAALLYGTKLDITPQVSGAFTA